MPKVTVVVEGLVSTIIPVHNRPVLLREAVASVLAQTYRPIEIVIVDDGSTDDTPDAADALAAQNPAEIRVVHQANGGPGLAREAGRQAANGEFIQYLDSDDVLLPRKFERQVEGLRRAPECGVSYGLTAFVNYGERAKRVPWKRTGEKIDAMFPSFLESRWWGTSTPLYRRSLIDAAGSWSNLRNEEDWEYDCRIAAFDVKLHYVPDFVSEEREHQGDRLSRGGTVAKDKLDDRARAHRLIYEHAMRAGIRLDTAEMQHYARELFLLSRQCGAAGLTTESRELFFLAKAASGAERAKGLDFRLYEVVARVLGWPLAGRLACVTDRLRP